MIEIIEKLFKKKNEKEVLTSETAERFTPDPDMGLSAEQIEQRIGEGLSNVTNNKASKTVLQIILTNLFTYFNIIFFVIAIILISVGTNIGNLTFLVIVVANTVIGIVQELRAKETLEKLSLVSAPLTKAIRDGKEEMVNSDDLVLDDIVVFSAGNQISADANVIDGEINVNESLVTGESDEIKKTAGSSLLSGSYVVSGSCRARLIRVGEESFAARLANDAKKIKKKQQPGMMKSLTLLIKIIGIIIIPLAILTYYNQHYVLKYPVQTSVESMAGSVLGMIPDGLYLLTTIALAASAIRLAKRNTLVHDMRCIETLARVDVICVDKTGTVTEPQMHVKDIIGFDGVNGEELHSNLRTFVMNMSSDSITMSALKEHFDSRQGYKKATAIKGFSSATKFSALTYGGNVGYVLGAPEFVMKSDYEHIKDKVEAHSSNGERVLLFAEYVFDEDSNIFANGDFIGNVIPLGIVTLKNRVRPEAKETFGYFAKQGVAIKVISGDNPLTVSKAAEEAGIPDYDKYIDATTLVTKEKVAAAATEYTVFGRVTPEQKRLLVKALKKAGHTVAMTGDGVNDVLALKDADCSIAMASGSEAAANVSDLVLLDSNFSSMPSVVGEGRRVINNIERSASLFLMKNIFTFFLTIIALFSQSLYPLKPANLSLVSMFMIGIPSFFLALEPNENLVKGKFLRNVLFKAFPCALTSIVLVTWSIIFVRVFDISSDVSFSVAFFLFSFVAYIMLFRVCRPMNLLHKILFGGMGLLYIVSVLVLPNLFEIKQMNAQGWMVLTVLIAISIPLYKLFFGLFNNFGSWKNSIKEYLINDVEKHKNDETN